jgi:hypothetical protein
MEIRDINASASPLEVYKYKLNIKGWNLKTNDFQTTTPEKLSHVFIDSAFFTLPK